MSQYPEHEKMRVAKVESQAQGELLDWMSEKGYLICAWDPAGEEMVFVKRTIQQLLAEFHGIDLDKIEEEKRQMLDTLRTANS